MGNSGLWAIPYGELEVFEKAAVLEVIRKYDNHIIDPNGFTVKRTLQPGVTTMRQIVPCCWEELIITIKSATYTLYISSEECDHPHHKLSDLLPK